MRETHVLNLVAALPEIHLLPHHCAPHTEETPQVVKGSPVKGVFISTAVFEVGDAVAWHELPRGSVKRNQVEVGAKQEQHNEREKGYQHSHCQQHAVSTQPQLPDGRIAETRPEVTQTGEQQAVRAVQLQQWSAVTVGVILTRRCAAPKAAPTAGRPGKAQTSGGSSHQHSSQSRGSDGRNAGHSADMSGSALISLAAAWKKIISFQETMNTNLH